MIHAFGMKKAHYDLIIGPRSDWTGKEVDMICNTYDRKRIKIMDAALFCHQVNFPRDCDHSRALKVWVSS